MPFLEDFKERIRHLKGETYVISLAARYPETPWYTNVFVARDNFGLLGFFYDAGFGPSQRLGFVKRLA